MNIEQEMLKKLQNPANFIDDIQNVSTDPIIVIWAMVADTEEVFRENFLRHNPTADVDSIIGRLSLRDKFGTLDKQNPLALIQVIEPMFSLDLMLSVVMHGVYDIVRTTNE